MSHPDLTHAGRRTPLAHAKLCGGGCGKGGVGEAGAPGWAPRSFQQASADDRCNPDHRWRPLCSDQLPNLWGFSGVSYAFGWALTEQAGVRRWGAKVFEFEMAAGGPSPEHFACRKTRSVRKNACTHCIRCVLRVLVAACRRTPVRLAKLPGMEQELIGSLSREVTSPPGMPN